MLNGSYLLIFGKIIFLLKIPKFLGQKSSVNQQDPKRVTKYDTERYHSQGQISIFSIAMYEKMEIFFAFPLCI